jgi:GNAT superfamily N-acetyltransferase
MEPGRPWTDLIQQTIREQLPNEIVSGRVHCLGIWDDGELRGVAAYRIVEWICRNQILAVANGHRRKRYGSTLKRAVMDAARQAGAQVVDSIVDRRNIPMLELNRSLGGIIDVIDDDQEYFICVIPI